MNHLGNFRDTANCDVRISAINLGPVANSTVDLRPLTVFVGPSNTGKTYFATLVYALHGLLEGFPRLPYQTSQLPLGLRHEQPIADADVIENELNEVLRKLRTEEKPFKFSDLPRGMRNLANASLNDPKFIGEELRAELERCFDLESIPELIRLFESSMNVSLTVGEEGRLLWGFQMEISASGMTTSGRIEDMVLLPERWSATKSIGEESFLFRKLTSQINGLESFADNRHQLEEFLDLLYRFASGKAYSSHYLPAARSGIMQSHRVIASSLVARSTRIGFERFPEIPTFSGVMADFLEQFILYQKRRPTDSNIDKLASALEQEALAGRIEAKMSETGGYPEFIYRLGGTQQEISLSRTSSMVSELAPIVLLLRGPVRPGDLLIIEEPEAHLHPAAQTRMAVTIGRMVRAGIRVLVTTHSEWLLKEFGNLLREGELEEKTGESTNGEILPCALRTSEVGIWLFRRDEATGGSTVEEIPFDRSEGVEPRDYEDVAEELYNRSANLQNQLEERENE